MVKVYDNRACVVHAHPMKEGSKTDKPIGTPIKCYYFKDHGRKQAIKLANIMHYAIMMSEKNNK